MLPRGRRGHLWSQGTGADVMKRIATPMVGGVITSGFMELAIYPVIFYLWKSRKLEDSMVPTIEEQTNGH